MASSYPLRLNNILVLVVRVARRHTFLHPLLVLRPLPSPTITPIYCDTPQLMGSESVSLMFTESWLDAPGPSRCTCVLPAWTSAARVPKDTTLSTDDHDGKMKTRWSKALFMSLRTPVYAQVTASCGNTRCRCRSASCWSF